MSAISTRRGHAIIAAVAVIGSIHALYFIQNTWIDRQAAQERTTLLEKELAYSRRKLISHDVFAEQLKGMRPLLSQLEQRLPTHLDPSSIEVMLRERAAKSNVEIANLRTHAEIMKEGFYAEIPVTFQVEGPAKSFFSFMDQVLRASPLRYVREMQIEPLDGSGVRAHLVMMYAHHIEVE